MKIPNQVSVQLAALAVVGQAGRFESLQRLCTCITISFDFFFLYKNSLLWWSDTVGLYWISSVLFFHSCYFSSIEGKNVALLMLATFDDMTWDETRWPSYFMVIFSVGDLVTLTADHWSYVYLCAWVGGRVCGIAGKELPVQAHELKQQQQQ